MIVPATEKSTTTVTITADTSEFEQSIDRCMVRLRELIRLGEQANKILDAKREHEQVTADEQIEEIRTHIVDIIRETANAVSPADYASDIAALVHVYRETFDI